MRINKNVQYGLLLVLYICRAGRTTITNASEGLRISNTYLQQIANKLKNAEVLKSFKGPKGGYELAYEVTVGDIFNALDPIALITQQESSSYVVGDVEHRAFASLTNKIRSSINPQLNRTIRNIEKEFTVNELDMLNSLTANSVLN